MNRSDPTSRRRSALAALGVAAAAALALLRAPAAAEARPDDRARAAEQPRTGQQIYSTTCAACHQPNGEGNGETYPPLAGSEWVTGSDARLARIILHGLTGEVEVAGQTYSGMMPPWKDVLKDEEIAAVATYIRTAWGNKGAAVTTASVAGVRKAHASRTTPWTVAELEKAGIPVSK
jgi:mono/diheme cytochrome c family protein